ncbi:MAG: ABC transporter substrate-binding protein [Candidatus Velthaea sp.]
MPAAGARHSWTVPDTLRIAVGTVPRTLNPLLATQTVESMLARFSTDILVAVDARGNFAPDLAKEVPTTGNGGISADGLTIRYRLRDGVKWHDGAPFTSKDVKFSFDAIMNPNNDIISRHGYDVVKSVETPDAHMVVFRLKHRFAPFVATVFGESDSPYAIVPEHLLGRLKSINDAPYNSAPIGTGPFKFVRWLRANQIEYERFDGYFLGRPKLKSIVVKLVPDENTEITLLRSHEIDWFFEVTVNAYKEVRRMSQSDVRIVLTPFNGYEGIMMNNARGPTRDPRVRRAIVAALDKDALVRNLTYGAALPATEDLPSFLWAYDRTLRPAQYDPQAARALLAQAGYGPGRRLTLDMYFEQSAALNKNASVQIQSALHDVGIDLRLHSQLSSVIYGGYGAGGTLARGKYDLALYNWIAGIDPDDSAQFSCSERPPRGFNQSFYCSVAADAAETAALQNYDSAKRKTAYARIQEQLARDAPMDFLWWPRQIQAVNPDLQNFDPNPVVESWGAYQWSI